MGIADEAKGRTTEESNAERPMFEQAPDSTIITLRVREPMRRDIERGAKRRGVKFSEEARRRLQFASDHERALKRQAKAAAKTEPTTDAK